MTYEEIQKEFEEDMNISKSNLQEKLSHVPYLHSKYLRYYFLEKDKLITMESALLNEYRKKYYYYLTEYDYELEKKQIEWHINSDSEYRKKKLIVDKQKNLFNYIENVLKSINQLSYNLKNIIEWERFTNGLN